LLYQGRYLTNVFTIKSSTIIPSKILPQANPHAPNSSKRGKIVEEFWTNNRKIFEARAAGKNCKKKKKKLFARTDKKFL
jgi:hypothetical protein